MQGWLWVYVIGSIPLMVVYSMGLSGWFFEYPIGLMLATNSSSCWRFHYCSFY